MSKKADSLPLGFTIGIIIPILSIVLVYFVKFSEEFSVIQFIETLFVLKIYTKVMAVAVYFGNIVSFFLFLKIDRLKSARGVLTATVIYSFVILILRLSMSN